MLLASSTTSLLLVLVTLATIDGCALFVELDGLSGNESSPAVNDSGGGGLGDAAPISIDGSSPPSDSSTARDTNAPPPLADGGCNHLGGPQPVRIKEANVTFCIDSTEVTRKQYLAFLTAGPKTADLPPECQWKTGFVPGGVWPPSAMEENLPTSSVDWCDAFAFCTWAGKHLCGKIGGGPVANPKDTNVSEWLYACSRGGTRIFPYGNTYDPLACNSEDFPAGKLVSAGTLPKCVGGWDGIFDMSANAHELLDSCTPAPDGGPRSEDECVMANSAYDGHGEDDSKCDSFTDWERSERHQAVSFRCCSN